MCRVRSPIGWGPIHEYSFSRPTNRRHLCSVRRLLDRATERLTGIHRDTIMRLGVRIGDGCAALHDELMQFVQVNRLELDEL
jgi:hypothetical protein